MDQHRLIRIGSDHEIGKRLLARVELCADAAAGQAQVIQLQLRHELPRLGQKGLQRPPVSLIIVFAALVTGGRSNQHAARRGFGEVRAQDARLRLAADRPDLGEGPAWRA